jgi:predicted kinase
MLIIFAGLPGVGKTTLAKGLALKLAAPYIRIDTIEQALLSSHLNIQNIEDAGYVVGYALAKDNLTLGRTVIADSVNPIELTRQAWRNIAKLCNTKALEVEVVCSNIAQHKNQAETRIADIKGHLLPTWQKIITREYTAWNRNRIIIDTADKTASECIEELVEKIQSD